MANPSARFDIVANSRVAGAFGKVRGEMRKLNRDAGTMRRGMVNNRRVIQQAGMQLSDFAVQVGGGQNAILAFTQNFPQFIQGFGALGGVLAALITIGGTLALVMTKTGKSLNDLTPIAGVLSNEFQMLAKWFGIAKEAAIDFANLVINNLDTVLITATVLTGFMVGKWVAGWLLAAGAVGALTKAFVALRFVLKTLGIGLLIYGIVWAVDKMKTLVKATGSWALALTTLRNVAKKVWGVIAAAGDAMGMRLKAMWMGVRAAFAKALKWMAEKWADFVAGFGGGVNRMSELMGGSGDIVDVMGIGAWASSFDAAVIRFEKSGERLRKEASDLEKKAFASLIVELQELLDIMKAVDKDGKKIDIRDWFGGLGGKDKKGGGKDTLTEIQEKMKSLADTIKTSMSEAFMSVIEGTKKMKDAFRDMARAIIKKLFDILVVQQLVGSWDASAGTGTGITGMIMRGIGGLKIFEGGGFTGSGARSGGVDGKGGFPAILHPNETVIDHTKPGSGGGSRETVVIHQTIQVSTGVQSTVRAEIAALMPRINEQTKMAVLDAKQRGGAFGRAL